MYSPGENVPRFFHETPLTAWPGVQALVGVLEVRATTNVPNFLFLFFVSSLLGVFVSSVARV